VVAVTAGRLLAARAAGLGAHQPNRRLRLAAEPQTGRREVSAPTDARKTLAYDFFRILRAPLFAVDQSVQVVVDREFGLFHQVEQFRAQHVVREQAVNQ